MGYRSSAIMREGYIVLEAKLRLKQGEPEKIAGRMEELKERESASSHWSTPAPEAPLSGRKAISRES